MPVVHPADVWRASGRYDAIGPELARFKDRNGRDMVLAMTHEEVVGILLARHRQVVPPAADAGLPLPDQVARRAARARRPDPRPRVRHEGRLQLRPRRGRPRRQLPGASTTPTSGSSSGSGSTTIAVASDVGIMGGSRGPRVHGPQPRRRGRPRPVRGVRLRRQPPGRARSSSPSPAAEDAAPARGGRDARHDDDRDPRRVPRHRPETRTAKAAFFMTGDGRLVTAIVRGDHEVNETKLVERRQGASAGSGPPRSRRSRRPGWSPATARRSAPTTRSSSSTSSSRARRTSSPARTATGFHYRNVNVGRDFTPDVVADITNAREGDPCPTCGSPVILRNGIEVGNIFKLGTKFTDAARRDVPRRGRRGAPDRHGLVRDRRRAERRLHRRGPPRREGDRLARGGRAVRRPPRRDRREQGSAGRRDRRAAPRRRRGRRLPAARSCTTTATSRRA